MSNVDLEAERQEKIQEYEKFVEERLKVDLKKVLEQRDRIYDQQAQ